MPDYLERFDALGLTVSAKPNVEQVVLPDDISDLSSEQLAEKFTALTAWTNYIESQFAIATIAEHNAERALREHKEIALTTRGPAERGERITAIKAQIDAQSDTRELSREHDNAYAFRKMVEMVKTNHERSLALVSREITRRSNDLRATRSSYGYNA